MPRYAQLVMGPAGCGKSTYCSTIVQHGEAIHRVIRVVNLDPAAEHFNYECIADIRELIHLDDAMNDEELHFGPNGGLVFCMEYLAQNFDWLEEQLGDYDDDYILFDCPGQIELYTHIPVMRQLVDRLRSWDFRICGIFMLDSQFLVDIQKYFSGALVALSTMVNLEIPHVNVLSKMDLLNKQARKNIEKYIEPAVHLLDERNEDEGEVWKQKFHKLSSAIANLIDDYSLVQFVPLDITDEESIGDLTLMVDMSIQYGEDQDVKVARDPEEPEDDANGEDS